MNNTSRRRRTEKRLSLTGLATKALLIYGTYKIASWAWSSFVQKDDEEEYRDGTNVPSSFHDSHKSSSNGNSPVRRKHKRMQLQKCREEIVMTMSSFLPTLKNSMEALTDFSQATQELKQLRIHNTGNESLDRKQVLWNEIKVKSMTRLIGTLYAHSLVYLLLTVQIHLLVGHASRHRQGHEEDTEIKVQTQKILLTQSYEYFFETGIQNLVNDVQLLVEQESSDWQILSDKGVLGKIGKDDFECMMQRLRKGLDTLENFSIFQHYVCPPDYEQLIQDDAVVELFDETLDILESPSFDAAKKDCIDTSFRVLQEGGCIKTLFEGSPSAQFFLANIVTNMKKVPMTFYEMEKDPIQKEWSISAVEFPNIYISFIHFLQSVKDLGVDCFTFT